jgi:hypothetical protein
MRIADIADHHLAVVISATGNEFQGVRKRKIKMKMTMLQRHMSQKCNQRERESDKSNNIKTLEIVATGSLYPVPWDFAFFAMSLNRDY